MVRFLVENGADVNDRSKDDLDAFTSRPLGEGDIEVVRFLVENGADVNARTRSVDMDLNGYTPLT